MCGIVGLFPYKTTDLDIDPRVVAVVQRMLFSESLVYMEPRGRDSTGIALLWDDNEAAIVKQPVHATLFAKDDGLWGEKYTNPDDKDANFKWLMDTWMRNFPDVKLRQALGHVRAGTKGSEYIPHNNHPIIVSSEEFGEGGKIKGELTIGIHNGGIQNDDLLERKHKFSRKGSVDSEVIFHLIHKYRNDYTVKNLEETFKELSGAYSVMAFNPAIPNKVACIRETRPLNAAFIPEIGTLILISEGKYLKSALEQYERWRIRESNEIFYYTDADGTEHNLGRVYDNFPYIKADFYDTSTVKDTIETGVFVLDTDTKVDSKTKVKDLVKVTKVFKPVAHTSYGRNIAAVVDKRSTPASPPSTPATTATAETAETTPAINDLTEYSEVELGAMESDEASSEHVEVEVLEVAADEEEFDDGCPYEWEERIKQATNSLYSTDQLQGSKLTLSRTNEFNVQELLESYLIKTKDANEAVTMLANFYDIIFPEGFAVGFAKGYETAVSDTEAHAEGEGELEDSLRQENTCLEEKLVNKEQVVASLLKEIQKVKKKQERASYYISTMRPLLSHLLAKEGVIDENGQIVEANFEELKKEIGIDKSSPVSTVARRLVSAG
jgi:hypothetical protein